MRVKYCRFSGMDSYYEKKKRRRKKSIRGHFQVRHIVLGSSLPHQSQPHTVLALIFLYKANLTLFSPSYVAGDHDRVEQTVAMV